MRSNAQPTVELAVVHPLFPGAPNDSHDVAVFVLDEPVNRRVYGDLPTLGLLDSIDKRSTLFTTVGYGTVRDDKRFGFRSLELGPGLRERSAAAMSAPAQRP